MASFRNTCEHCRTDYTAYNGRSRFCSGACRVGAYKEAQARRVAALRELLAEQTAALDSGADPIVLAELARRAKRLLDGV
jgi:hypothetical protein